MNEPADQHPRAAPDHPAAAPSGPAARRAAPPDRRPSPAPAAASAASAPAAASAAGQQYFAASPASASDPQQVEVALADGPLRFRTDRGVFSHGRLDTGTGVLLRSAPAVPPTGDLLDLGCGAGALALVMARRAPGATVWAVDVNERAVALCAANAAAAGLANVRAVAPAQVPADVRFAAIWSNPPIRIGKDALHELLLTWLGRLAPGGAATLVVQRHLGSDSLAGWLAAQGHPTARVASAKGYRVLEVRPRDRAVQPPGGAVGGGTGQGAV